MNLFNGHYLFHALQITLHTETCLFPPVSGTVSTVVWICWIKKLMSKTKLLPLLSKVPVIKRLDVALLLNGSEVKRWFSALCLLALFFVGTKKHYGKCFCDFGKRQWATEVCDWSTLLLGHYASDWFRMRLWCVVEINTNASLMWESSCLAWIRIMRLRVSFPGSNWALRPKRGHWQPSNGHG